MTITTNSNIIVIQMKVPKANLIKKRYPMMNIFKRRQKLEREKGSKK